MAAAEDIPYIFSENSMNVSSFSASQLVEMTASNPDLVGIPAVVVPSDDEALQFPVTGGGSMDEGETEKLTRDFKDTLDSRVEVDNPSVHYEALVLAAKYPGDHTVDQICSIYSYLKNGNGSTRGWSYVPDPRGLDYFNYANESLRAGSQSGCAGAGDCDDFAILMSALVESVGGTTRIIMAKNATTGGHAYTEVYLGRLDDGGSQVREIIDWLSRKFHTNKIYTHIDTDTREVWLNLDWGSDERGNSHPGGPFYPGDRHLVLCIRDQLSRTPLRVPDATVGTSGKDASAAIISSIKAVKPGSAESWINKGQSLLDLGKYYEAIDAYNKAIEADQTGSVAWKRKGDVFLILKKYEDSLQSYEKAIELDPEDADAWVDKGLSLEKMGKDEPAIKAYNTANDLDPDNVRAWLNKGGALDRVGRYSEGLDASETAIGLDDTSSMAWNNKGDALFNLGRYDESLAAFERAVELDPSNQAAWTNRGTALNMLGRKSEAYAAFARANELRGKIQGE
jgi:Flp pilus assembly protein TadD